MAPRVTSRSRIRRGRARDGRCLQLTQAQIDRSEARAAGEIRPAGNHVAWVIQQHLAESPARARPRDADPSEERIGYDVGPFLAIPERRKLEKRAAAERRFVSSHVTVLLLESLSD